MNHRAHLHSAYLPMSVYGTPYLWFESLQGTERVNELYVYKLIVKTKDAKGNPAHSILGLEGYVGRETYKDSILESSQSNAKPQESQHQGTYSYQSPASHLDVLSLIGTPLGVSLDLNDVHPLDNRTITGEVVKHALITAVTQLTTHNRHAVYEFTLMPWLYLLTQTNNYRIYQNSTIADILNDVLSHYPYAYEFKLTADYVVQDYQTQYDESDYAFIARLMNEYGINFYFEHQKDNHTLIITDSNEHFTPHDNPFYSSLTLYPPHQRMPEYAEYLEQFTPTQSLTIAQSLVADYQFKTPQTPLTAHESQPWQHKHNTLQHYQWAQGRRADEEALTVLNNTLMQAYHQKGLTASGKGRLKGIQVGKSFSLTGHPNEDSNRQWLVLGTTIHIYPINQDDHTNTNANTHQYYTADTTFTAQPLSVALRPTPSYQRPIARPQTAIIVAPEEEEIYTDQYGRMKVKFHWDKPSLADRQIIDNRTSTAQDTTLNTCWLRLANHWSGHHYGVITLPRVGQEVIVDFFGGNPNMPYIAGTLHNPDNMPPFTLPEEKVLSGIKSKEYQGEHANQLIFDDTTGKLQTQLKSDHLHSELNLGHIRRLESPKGRGEYRGEGFELRSDGHGSIRADKGVIVSTYGREGALGHIKDLQETIDGLQKAIYHHELLLDQAIQALCETRAVNDTVVANLKTQLESVTGKKSNGGQSYNHPEIMTPQVVISSKSDTILESQGNIQFATQDTLSATSLGDMSLASMQNYNLTTAKSIKMFSHQEGIKLYANQGNIELQAQNNTMTLTAKKDIEIVSTEQTIDIVASKQIRLRCEGSQITMDKNGITLITDGTFKVKANQHDLQQGQTVGVDLKGLPIVDLFNEKFQILSPTGKPMAFVDYQLSSDNHTFASSTQDNGQTKEVHTPQEKDVSLEIVWMELEECDDNEWLGSDDDTFGLSQEQLDKYPSLTKRMQGKQRFLGESTAMRYLIEADNNAGLAWERLRIHRSTYKGVRQADRNAEHYLYALDDIRSRDGVLDKSFTYNSYQFILTPGYELAKATANGTGKITEFVSGENISPFSKDNPATYDEYLAGYYGAQDAMYGIREP